ncbi:ATP-binding protein [Streptomyces sp. NPDC005551]|uniref:ATP-binding protein n=1 Tax=Streptomyces sp. NPDC005551 TaxID=3364725 RepID=UPI0036B1461A
MRAPGRSRGLRDLPGAGTGRPTGPGVPRVGRGPCHGRDGGLTRGRCRRVPRAARRGTGRREGARERGLRLAPALVSYGVAAACRGPRARRTGRRLLVPGSASCLRPPATGGDSASGAGEQAQVSRSSGGGHAGRGSGSGGRVGRGSGAHGPGSWAGGGRRGAGRGAGPGPGIAEGDGARVFDRSYRAADACGRPGSGLGLSIAREVAASLGGTVFALRGEGGGAVIGFSVDAGGSEDDGRG